MLVCYLFVDDVNCIYICTIHFLTIAVRIIIHASVCKMKKKNLLILLDENLNLSEYGIDFICIFMDFGDKTNPYPWRYMCVTCVMDMMNLKLTMESNLLLKMDFFPVAFKSDVNRYMYGKRNLCK